MNFSNELALFILVGFCLIITTVPRVRFLSLFNFIFSVSLQPSPLASPTRSLWRKIKNVVFRTDIPLRLFLLFFLLRTKKKKKKCFKKKMRKKWTHFIIQTYFSRYAATPLYRARRRSHICNALFFHTLPLITIWPFYSSFLLIIVLPCW